MEERDNDEEGKIFTQLSGSPGLSMSRVCCQRTNKEFEVSHDFQEAEMQLELGPNVAEDTRPRENLDYFERTRDLWLANFRSNNDHNAFQSDFEATDPEAEEFARSLLIDPQCDTDTEPIHVRVKKCSGVAIGKHSKSY
ncbi:hypothetical protein ACE6H2_019619 [Prunus campanulata]